jgi:hypothetical protein
MTRSKGNKFALLPIVLTIMLIITGVSYAWWQGNLTITGSLTTTNFHATVSLPVPGGGPIPFFSGDNEEPEKDIGYVKDVTIDQDTNKFTINISDAYPCYEAWILLGIENNGDLPLHIKEIIYEDVPPELEIWFEPYIFDGFDPIPILDIQLYHGQEYWFWIHIHIFEDDDSEPPIQPQQNTDYSFSIILRTIQYNYHTPPWPPGP